MSPKRPRSAGLTPQTAPGRLAVVQDFVNTRTVARDADALQDVHGLESWLAAHDLVLGEDGLGDEEWRQALALREGLRRVIRSHNVGGRLGAAAVAELNRLGSQVVLRHHFQFDGEGSPRLVPAAPGWPGAVARLLGWISEAREEGRWTRLKECAAEDCQRIFYDASKNRSAKWCTGRRCGNRVYTETYRRRKPVWRRGR